MEDVLSYVDQRTQGFRKELTKKIDDTEVALQTVRASVDTRTESLLETMRQKRAPSRRAGPHDPGRDTDDETPNRYHEEMT